MSTNTLDLTRDPGAVRSSDAALIMLDTASFDPWRIQPVRHRLSTHPMLQLPALVRLGSRLEAIDSIRTHSTSATAATPFNNAPRLHPNAQGAVTTLADIANANAWMSLLNVQLDPEYRSLVGDVLDSVRPTVEPRDPGMHHLGGWIFVSSPHAVTPFHFDKEHNFILQISGRKRVYVWDHRDTEVASDHARDRFHFLHERDLLQWREEFRSRARVFDLGPGEGAYMPSTSPHLVENGDEPSITVSFTYYTRSTCRDALLHKAHELMRNWGIVPPGVGRSRAFDTLTHATFASVLWLRNEMRMVLWDEAPHRPTRFAQVAM